MERDVELDPFWTRRQAAAELTAAGFPVAEATLATLATRGGGPPFQKFGRRVLYRRGATLDWAYSRVTSVRRNTSESLRVSPGVVDD